MNISTQIKRRTFGAHNEALPGLKPTSQRNDYSNTAYLLHPDLEVLPPKSSERSLARRDCVIEDFLDMIDLAMKGYQSYWQSISDTNAFMVRFPFARYLDVGDKILNLTTSAVYTIDQVHSDIDEHCVTLASQAGATAPVHGTDILRLDFDNARHLRFSHAYPASDDVNRYFTEEAMVKNATEPFQDTIAYKVQEHTPGGREFFSKGTKQLAPQMRDERLNPVNNKIETVYGQHFDSEIYFQCWTPTNEATARLARWFRTFMRRYRNVFKENGVIDAIFLRQGSEYNVTRWRNDIVGTTCVYGVRTEELYSTEEVLIKELKFAFMQGGGREQITLSHNNKKVDIQ